MDESTLVRHAANGDTAAWEPLMLAHQQAVFRFAYLLLGDPDEAEDIAQETFLRAWDHLSRFDPSRPLRPWLLSIAANLASNKRRSASRYLAALTRAFRSEPPSATIEEKVPSTSKPTRSGKPFKRSTSQTSRSFICVIFSNYPSAKPLKR